MGAKQLFADGGVIGRNPSKDGGTWAWRLLDGGLVVAEGGGYITPGQMLKPTVTNNHTEMLALVRGLQHLPTLWIGTVYTDSQVTLGRAHLGWKWTNIPEWLVREFGREVERLVGWNSFAWMLLAGHPTQDDLEVGWSAAKRLPVSQHNVWCDQECGRQAQKYWLDQEQRAFEELADMAGALP